MIAGFDGAYERLRACLGQIETPVEVTFLPLFEALNWAVALSDLAKDEGLVITSPPDDVAGVRFARHRVHHQWARALVVGDVLFPQPLGATNRPGSKLSGPVTVRAWKWVPAAELPDAEAGHSHPNLEAAYVAQLQGQQAQAVLDRFSMGLSALR